MSFLQPSLTDSTMTLTLTRTTTKPNTFASLGDNQIVLLTTYVSAITISKLLSQIIPTPTPVPQTLGLVLSALPTAMNSTNSSSSLSTAASVFNLGSTSSNAWKVGLAVGVPGAIAAVIGLTAFLLISLKKRSSNRKANSSYLSSTKSFSLSSDYSEKSVFKHDPIPVRRFDAETPNLEELQKWPAVCNRLSRLFVAEKNKEPLSNDPIVCQVVKNPLPDSNPSPLTALLLKRFNLRSRIRAMTPKLAFPRAKDELDQLEKGGAGALNTPGTKQESIQPIIPLPTAALSSGRSDTNEYLVIRRYALQLPDEMSIDVGDKIIVSELFSDGWCKASRGATVGIVPQVCLQKL